MKRQRVFLAICMAFFIFQSAFALDATLVGKWTTLPYTVPINPVHITLLPTGKVLIVAGSENDPTVRTYRAAVLDLTTGVFSMKDLDRDLFCNALVSLPNGQVFIAGGTKAYDPFYGNNSTNIFDPVTEQFTDGPDMAEGRWYPTLTPLADGMPVIISGLTEYGSTSNTLEFLYGISEGVYGWSNPFVAPFTPALYPHGHLLPNGQVFYSGPEPQTRMLEPDSFTWTDVAFTQYGGWRSGGASVLLPLTPGNFYTPNVVIMGGDENPATSTVERIDLSVANPEWVSVSPMKRSRIYLNATLLPDGKVLVTGGSGIKNDGTTARRLAEIFNPATNGWTNLASAQYWRDYHSVALLLPDATVLTMGGNPNRGVYDKHVERFSPPYLYTKNSSSAVVAAPRSVIKTFPGEVSYGNQFTVTFSGKTPASVVLIPPGAVTHAIDMQQRVVGLDFTVVSAGKIQVKAPPNGAIAPPGNYMMFLVDANGVPSKAKFIHIASL